MHTHVFVALQVPVPGQVPHETVPPQPSGMVPHWKPAGQAAGVQPHTFGFVGVPPPQVSGKAQTPHVSCPPQPFETVPQLSPVGHAVIGVHPTHASFVHVAQVLLVAVHCSHAP